MARFATIKIPAELFAPAESSRYEGLFDLGTLHAGSDEYRFSDPVAWEVDVTNTGEALLVSGRASGCAVVDCARCLDEVEFDLEGEIEGYFLIGSEQDGVEGLDDDEFDVLPSNHEIDLVPLIEAALLVEVPFVPLCRDDCAGLCPNCGANLNEGDCGCGGDAAVREFDEAANPFSVLKRIDLG